MANENLNTRINIKEIMEIIKSQFFLVIERNKGLYLDTPVYITDEQQFIKNKNLIKPNAIYIVVRFGNSPLIFGQVSLPVSFMAIGEKNKIDMCRNLLIDYGTSWNQQPATKLSDITNLDSFPIIADRVVQQIYYAPSVQTNFNEVESGFRSLFVMNGNLLISEYSNPSTLYYQYEYEEDGETKTAEEEVPAITKNPTYNAQLDSQAYYSTQNFTKSVAKIATNTFSIVLPLTSDIVLCNNALRIKYKDTSINNEFKFKFVHANGIGNPDYVIYKLVSINIQEQVGQLPLLSLTFTE